MSQGNPRSDHPDIFALLDRINSSSDVPDLQTFLDLGQALLSARLDYFATIPVTNPFIDPNVGAAFNLVLAVTDLARHPEHQAIRNDAGKAQTALDNIVRWRCWLYVRDELVKLSKRLEVELVSRKIEGKKKAPAKQVKRDAKTEARDKWIYQQCCKRLGYASISRLLKNDHPEWDHIESATGILAAAKRYAKRHGKTPPPSRLEQS